jgi:hypothetical protein
VLEPSKQRRRGSCSVALHRDTCIISSCTRETGLDFPCVFDYAAYRVLLGGIHML